MKREKRTYSLIELLQSIKDGTNPETIMFEDDEYVWTGNNYVTVNLDLLSCLSQHSINELICKTEFVAKPGLGSEARNLIDAVMNIAINEGKVLRAVKVDQVTDWVYRVNFFETLEPVKDDIVDAFATIYMQTAEFKQIAEDGRVLIEDLFDRGL